jgi:hypothetical protein
MSLYAERFLIGTRSAAASRRQVGDRLTVSAEITLEVADTLAR